MAGGAFLEAILIASAAGEPMQRLTEAEVIAGVGIRGDRYAVGRGHWSDPKWSDQEVTLIEAEVAEELRVRPEQLRRNLVIRGVPLADLIGREFRIGDVLFAGVRPCDPCTYVEQFSRPGISRLLAGRGGLRARVLKGGTVRVGDLVVLNDWIAGDNRV